MSVPGSNKKYDDSNWKEEYKIHTNSFFKLKLLEEGAKSLSSMDTWSNVFRLEEEEGIP